MVRSVQCAIVAAVLWNAPASASFHQIKIVEVFAGTPAAPDAQYVVLQMYAQGQTAVNGRGITVYDSTGAAIGSFLFTGNVANDLEQARILIATPQAAAFFNITADLGMTAVIPPRGGKLCYDPFDCIAWGSYAGSSSGVGVPFNAAGQPPCTARGIPPGKAVVRRLDVFGLPTVLEAGDDTGESAADFVPGTPAPKNNPGQVGAPPAATCGNGVLQGLEECDDHNMTDGDGCSSSCTSECPTTGVPGTESGIPRLSAAPTPFHGQVALVFTLQKAGATEITVHDVSGRVVRRLHRGMLAAGPGRTVWDGVDERGAEVRAGIYFVRLRSGGLDLRTTVVRSR